MPNKWIAESIKHEDDDLFVAIVTTLGGNQLIAQCTTLDFAKEIEDKHNRFDVEIGHLKFSLAGARDRAEAAEAERDEARRQLTEAQNRISTLEDWRNTARAEMSAYVVLIEKLKSKARELSAYPESRFWGSLPDEEEQLDIAIDGQGDEVEP